MEWKLFGHLREVAGGGAVAVDPGTDPTVGTALDALLDERPALREEVLADGDLADHVRVLVDGEDPFATGEGLSTPVETDAELALFPPVSGG
ncbi:ubiquitin-like small modifier protein 1 [Haloarcula litorea]|uniref:ubiquitin-like small modifier protein 1 n=1 Tax=Haloarcula litorea TaxID=3032579 RepID=UPI0023E823D9|nr:ubiquitin-like small modifier protein 1 [Halomicroarcula sp. GDY20]